MELPTALESRGGSNTVKPAYFAMQDFDTYKKREGCPQPPRKCLHLVALLIVLTVLAGIIIAWQVLFGLETHMCSSTIEIQHPLKFEIENKEDYNLTTSVCEPRTWVYAKAGDTFTSFNPDCPIQLAKFNATSTTFTPFPSLEFQRIDGLGAKGVRVTSVDFMQTDGCNNLWLVDKAVLMNGTQYADIYANHSKAQFIKIDLDTLEIISAEIPEEVRSGVSILWDFTIDYIRGVAYILDIGEVPGIIVFDMLASKANGTFSRIYDGHPNLNWKPKAMSVDSKLEPQGLPQKVFHLASSGQGLLFAQPNQFVSTSYILPEKFQASSSFIPLWYFPTVGNMVKDRNLVKHLNLCEGIGCQVGDVLTTAIGSLYWPSKSVSNGKWDFMYRALYSGDSKKALYCETQIALGGSLAFNYKGNITSVVPFDGKGVAIPAGDAMLNQAKFPPGAIKKWKFYTLQMQEAKSQSTKVGEGTPIEVYPDHGETETSRGSVCDATLFSLKNEFGIPILVPKPVE